MYICNCCLQAPSAYLHAGKNPPNWLRQTMNPISRVQKVEHTHPHIESI